MRTSIFHSCFDSWSAKELTLWVKVVFSFLVTAFLQRVIYYLPIRYLLSIRRHGRRVCSHTHPFTYKTHNTGFWLEIAVFPTHSHGIGTTQEFLLMVLRQDFQVIKVTLFSKNGSSLQNCCSKELWIIDVAVSMHSLQCGGRCSLMGTWCHIITQSHIHVPLKCFHTF